MSVNKVILVGNVGKDPDVRYLEKNVAVANFPLATTEKGYTMANGTVVPDKTEWHNIVLWRNLAEIAEKYVRKGNQIFIEGKIKTRSYEDKSGVKRYITEIYAENMQLLGKRDQQGSEAPAATVNPAASATPIVNAEPAAASAIEENNDDLPF